MSDPLTLTLPLPPNLANARMHWRVKERERKSYRQLCDFRLFAKQVPVPNVFPWPRVTVSATLYLWAQMDDDNALARIKWAADWLKTRGYIVDDKRPHCRFTIPEQVIDRADQRLVLTLTPLPP
jgi:hypothetical protein